jgi:hypothetical protein
MHAYPNNSSTFFLLLTLGFPIRQKTPDAVLQTAQIGWVDEPTDTRMDGHKVSVPYVKHQSTASTFTESEIVRQICAWTSNIKPDQNQSNGSGGMK